MEREKMEREDSKCLLDTPSQPSSRSRDLNQPRPFYHAIVTGPKSRGFG